MLGQKYLKRNNSFEEQILNWPVANIHFALELAIKRSLSPPTSWRQEKCCLKCYLLLFIEKRASYFFFLMVIFLNPGSLRHPFERKVMEWGGS